MEILYLYIALGLSLIWWVLSLFSRKSRCTTHVEPHMFCISILIIITILLSGWWLVTFIWAWVAYVNYQIWQDHKTMKKILYQAYLYYGANDFISKFQEEYPIMYGHLDIEYFKKKFNEESTNTLS